MGKELSLIILLLILLILFVCYFYLASRIRQRDPEEYAGRQGSVSGGG